jgi:hypothetical protein
MSRAGDVPESFTAGLFIYSGYIYTPQRKLDAGTYHTTIPRIFDRGTAPYTRLSALLFRLSPIMK